MAIPSEAPMPAQSPAPAQGAEAPGADAGGGKIGSLMSETFKNLAMLAELAGAGGDQALAQKVAAVKAQFEGILDDGPGAAPGGPVPMEAGAAKVSPAL